MEQNHLHKQWTKKNKSKRLVSLIKVRYLGESESHKYIKLSFKRHTNNTKEGL